MYNRQTNSFHHYDSCSAYNTSAARSLARNVELFLLGKILAWDTSIGSRIDPF